MGRKRKEPEAEGCALWVVTFGDAMSLLVTFFVMLVSFADFEEEALEDMLGALKGGLRAVPMPMATVVGSIDDSLLNDDAEPLDDAELSALSDADLSVISTDANQTILRNNSSDYYLHLLKGGVSLVIKRSAVFRPGTATLIAPDHEVWDLAKELMRSVHNETRVSVTLPERTMVRIEQYSTSWGLGIEQALSVQGELAKGVRGDRGQMGTSVRVIERMGYDEMVDGTVEIIYVGASELTLKGMPRKILRGNWRKQKLPDPVKEQGNG